MVAVGLGAAEPAVSGAAQASPVTTGTLLQEMADLEALARWPDPAYRVVQFGSADRRSTHPEAPGWLANADGFGGEPIPGFLKVLREPREGGAGLYLIAEVQGPGAIVRGWSAGMGGVLRVYLDPPADAAGPDGGALVWEGPAYDFLARRSVRYLQAAALAIEAEDAFVQQDADYLPMPFAGGLRVTWEGKLRDLHFYHLQTRLYPPGTPVRTFDPAKDLREFESAVRAAVSGLAHPGSPSAGDRVAIKGAIDPGRKWTWTPPNPGAGALRELTLKLDADPLEAALRGALLRIAFDGSQRPQVEAPLGDFFGSGPGVNPFSSLPMDVRPDGTMVCRFVMPFARTVLIEILNHTPAPVRFEGAIVHSPWCWDERSLHFRAKWRADHDLLAGPAAGDLPFLLAMGQGRFAGCAVMVMNPAGAPTAGGNWWGEGDEKILVDGETSPSTLGTGSEDYFNYSWSRPDLFDHPYCGQPLDSGPDTSGYVSNHRFQVLDAIPFTRSIAVLMELWSHTVTPGMSYSRVVYHYARPHAMDDHRPLMPSDLRITPLPRREPKAVGGASGARFHFLDAMGPVATAGAVATVPFPLATQLRVVEWTAVKGARLQFSLPVDKDQRATLHLVAVHRPDGATVRALLDDQPLRVAGGASEVRLRSAHAARVLNVHFEPVDLKAGTRTITLECVEPGPVGLDYVWVKGG
ncbi:MAG TPA: DUF2961 domain-containing protein [Verrucomicrobiota bacterium]|nr:DUF2961 domain-containing protein [Verrucomicrobiota bacterium]HNU51380.1 DUF2961 domain-containing protein [Verrucomicrobiota bacterium]